MFLSSVTQKTFQKNAIGCIIHQKGERTMMARSRVLKVNQGRTIQYFIVGSVASRCSNYL